MLNARQHLCHLAILCIVTNQSYAREDLQPSGEQFTEMALVRGIHATQADCEKISDAVWARPKDEQGECIRYWRGGFTQDQNPRVLVFFHGDLLAGSKLTDASYTQTTQIRMRERIESVAAVRGVPYIFMARPGTYGSSGEHRQRRRPAESKILSAALDEIKKRYSTEEFSIAGQSGGGHVVASLLTYRTDIVCAVAASAVSAPKARWQQNGWNLDSTGYSDSYEPTQYLQKAKSNDKLRVFVLGDPNDSNVPWSTQTLLADKLRELGVSVEVIQGEGAGSSHHGLSSSSTLVASMCLKGQSTEQILQRAARGLKG